MRILVDKEKDVWVDNTGYSESVIIGIPNKRIFVIVNPTDFQLNKIGTTMVARLYVADIAIPLPIWYQSVAPYIKKSKKMAEWLKERQDNE